MSEHVRVCRLLLLAVVAATPAVRAQDAMPPAPRTTGTLVREVCAPCHGVDGNSTRPDVPSLAGQVQPYLQGQLHAFAAQGGQRPNGVMGAIAVHLSADEMKRAAGYFARQPLRTSPVAGEPPRGQAAARRLFAAGLPKKGVASCASCHGTRGQGLPDLFPRLAGQHANYLAEQLRHFRSGSRTSDPQAVMRRVAGPLSDREIDAVSNYAAQLR